MAKRGRRSKYTKPVVDMILRAVAAGATFAFAAAAAGIHQDTLGEWRKNKPEFSDALKQAEARGVVTNVALIQQAAHAGQWQAAAWLLERRHPDDYGRRDRMQVQHEGSVDVKMIADLRAVILNVVEDIPTRIRIAEALAALDAAEGGGDGERSA